MFNLRAVTLGATMLLVPAIMAAQGKSKTKATPASGTSTSVAVGVVFRDPDRTVFRDYFARQQMVVTPLPPGIAKNLARGKPLPPGIAQKTFPRSIIVRPGLHADIVFIMVGHNMVAVRNGIVVDVMFNVFP
jgi:hypothetical protein